MTEMDVWSMAGVVLVFAAFAALAVAALVVAKVARKLLAAVVLFVLNSLTGLILLFMLVYGLHMDIPVDYYTIAASMLFGVGGVGTLILLSVGGLI